MEGRTPIYPAWPTTGDLHMRRFLAVPFLAVVLSAQAQPEMVVSVGHAGAPSLAAFAGGHLATASASNVALIDLSIGLTIAHLPQASLVTAIEANPAGDVIAVGTCGSANVSYFFLF
jgi:hypothetical protein